MAEAIDALHELETRHLDEARDALRNATRGLVEAESALASAERDVLAHDALVAAKLAPSVSTVSVEALARDDAYRRAMRDRRGALVGTVQQVLRARDDAEGALERARTSLADARARVRAIELRLEDRAAARQRAALAREEDEADEHRRR